MFAQQEEAKLKLFFLPSTCPLQTPPPHTHSTLLFQTFHPSVAFEEFGEEARRGGLVGLHLLFGFGLLLSEAQLPLQLLQF